MPLPPPSLSLRAHGVWVVEAVAWPDPASEADAELVDRTRRSLPKTQYCSAMHSRESTCEIYPTHSSLCGAAVSERTVSAGAERAIPGPWTIDSAGEVARSSAQGAVVTMRFPPEDLWSVAATAVRSLLELWQPLLHWEVLTAAAVALVCLRLAGAPGSSSAD